MQKPFVIRDPVHGYLRIAAHERTVVDHPVFQRLRYIAQTGAAHLVYPEARTSRFVHSLGAMHLASRFLLAALENAQDSVVRRFFDELESLGVFKTKLIVSADLDALLERDNGLSAARVLFRPKLSADEAQRRRRLLVLAEAAVRLAALFHDLGHLPFSHDLEFALRDYDRERPRALPRALSQWVAGTPHEEIGHALAGLVLASLVKPEAGPAVRAAYHVAQEILTAHPAYADLKAPKTSALQWLHSLVDGEIDVDRADYLLRDARELGFEFAAYDLERLVQNLVLVRTTALGFATAIKEPGLSAVESFFLSRSRSLQHLARHHKVAQVAAALRRGSVAAFDTAGGREFIRCLAMLARNTFSPASADRFLNRFAVFDDVWWMQELRRVRTRPTDKLTRACLDLLLSRGRTLTTLWKRNGDLGRSKVLALNRVVKTLASQPDFSKRIKKLRANGVLVTLHAFKAYGVVKPLNDSRESILRVQTGTGLHPVAKVSKLVRSLPDVWSADVHVHAFALADSVQPDSQAQVKLAETLRVLLGQ